MLRIYHLGTKDKNMGLGWPNYPLAFLLNYAGTWRTSRLLIKWRECPSLTSRITAAVKNNIIFYVSLNWFVFTGDQEHTGSQLWSCVSSELAALFLPSNCLPWQETEIAGLKPVLTLFDTGPDSRSIIRNIASLNIHTPSIDRVIISHWHADHSGGLLAFLSQRGSSAPPCVVDLHPSRPTARGIAPAPTYDKVIARLPADPTFKEIEKAGAKVEQNKEGHAIAGGGVWVSGEIPRVTEWEGGLLGGVRWFENENAGKGGWVNEEVSLYFSCYIWDWDC